MAQVSSQRLLLPGWLITIVQVNITTTTYDTGHTLIYITLVLLFMFFFILPPFFWAGWLSSIPLSVTVSTTRRTYLDLHLEVKADGNETTTNPPSTNSEVSSDSDGTTIAGENIYRSEKGGKVTVISFYFHSEPAQNFSV
jgi:hypothetical protein